MDPSFCGQELRPSEAGRWSLRTRLRRLLGTTLGLLLGLACLARAHTAEPPSIEQLLATAAAAGWDTLAIGERVACFGQALEGTPYLDRTLEGPGPEVCRVTTTGFDCVTFMETALNLARVTRDGGGRSRADLVDAITFTRYRGGRVNGYASRLHYTSEWIAENEKRRVIEDVTPALGGRPLSIRVDFMSSHPQLYPALRDDPALVDSLRAIERRIGRVPRTFIPRDRVAAIESRLRTGDLIAITTSVAGLDYSHTGMIVREGARARFLHASSAKGRVTLDEPIGSYLERGPRSNTGITVLRPLEPRKR